MLTVVTGAAGFVGRALAARMAERGFAGDVRLVDRTAVTQPRTGFHWVEADLTNGSALKKALAGADCVIHLAAIPGGASEENPIASREVNLDVSLALIEELELKPGSSRPRLIYASSIAVLGTPVGPVDDATAPSPVMTYGAHKLMVEVAVTDAIRRGRIDAVSLRLPGIIARPPTTFGLGSGFMSEVFHAIREGRSWTSPVAPTGTMWLMSAQSCADALIHAARGLPAPPRGGVTLPALRTSMADLVTAISAMTRRRDARVRYQSDPIVEKLFARMPALFTPAADALGFRHDGDLPTLVARALAGLT
jgi:nucleoside-diphosphate-sugar epimerase